MTKTLLCWMLCAAFLAAAVILGYVKPDRVFNIGLMSFIAGVFCSDALRLTGRP